MIIQTSDDSALVRNDVLVRTSDETDVEIMGDHMCEQLGRVIAEAIPAAQKMGTFVDWMSLGISRSVGPEPYTCFIMTVRVGPEEG